MVHCKPTKNNVAAKTPARYGCSNDKSLSILDCVQLRTYCFMDMLHISRRPYQNLLDQELECIRKKKGNRYSGIYHHPAKNEEDHNKKEEWEEKEETVEKAA